MKKTIFLSIVSVGMFFAFACNTTTTDTVLAVSDPSGHVKTKFKVDWSIYVGWNPWHYAQASNILSKWAKKYGIEIELQRMAYIPSIEAYNAAKCDACVMTNMDMLTMPINSGINSTVIIVGDYSNGNDAIITKDATITNLSQIKKIYGVQYSVSHYLLNRAEDKNKIVNDAIQVVNVSEDDITNMFSNDANTKNIVTWNPFVMNCMKVKGAKMLFNSSQIPGEILDLMTVNTDILEKNPDFAKALVGAWYEVMDVMSKKDAKSESAINIMAAVGESSVVEFNNQLATTALFYTPQRAIDFSMKPEFGTSMKLVEDFCIKYDLLKGSSDIGIQLPNEQILGNKEKIKLKFDMSFTKAAAAGKL